MIRIWASPYGDIRLPDEFPWHIFRKDGWWDMRYTAIRERWEVWIAAEEKKLQQENTMDVVNCIPNAIRAIEAEAAKELAEEKATAAKGKIKESLKRIAAAERVLKNLQDEHAVLLRDIGA